MAFSVTLYKNTGYNAVNIPDSPAKLAVAPINAISVPALDLICDWGLTRITVKSTSSQIYGVDYAKIGGYYYAVGKPSPAAADSWRLPLTYDGITTHGGPAALTYLDGVTERHTVGEDNMFEYTQEDEYLAPREALQITKPHMYYGGIATDANTEVVIESTIDLTALADEFNEDGTLNELKGQTFTDPNDSSQKVTVPYVKNVVGQTTYTIGTDANAAVVKAPNTRQYMAKDANITKALGLVRSLGVESSIISQVVYPDRFVQITTPDDDPHVQRIAGKEQSVKANSEFDYYKDAKNNRLAYGQYNKFCLITANGDRGEFLPEQIGAAGDDAPYIKMKADPRPNGKPYYRFAKYMGDDSDDGFWINSLSGLPWANAPLVYQGATNSYQTRAIFTNDARSAYNENQEALRVGYTGMASTAGIEGELNNLIADAAMAAAGRAGGVIDWAKDMFSGGLPKWGSGVNVPTDPNINNYLGAYDNAYMGDIGGRNYITDQYKIAREKELQSYGLSQSVVVPTVQFPFNADTVRDFKGNGVYFFRYHYSEADAARVDKLLTMYGYKDTVALTPDLFNKRKYFDYVRAVGVSIGGDIPMWEKSEIAAQLNAGVRIWHVKPDVSHYLDNPIIGGTTT